MSQSAHEKSHGMSLHRHAMTSILIRDNPCPVLPVRVYSSYRQVKRGNVNKSEFYFLAIRNIGIFIQVDSDDSR